MIKLLLESSEWEDASVDAAYLDRVHEYQADTIQRVKDLRTDAADTVERLADSRARIEDARDAIAQRHDELADIRSGLEAQEAELAAARAARRETLARLGGREDDLQSGIARAERRQAASIPPPVPGDRTPDVAAPPVRAPALRLDRHAQLRRQRDRSRRCAPAGRRRDQRRQRDPRHALRLGRRPRLLRLLRLRLLRRGQLRAARRRVPRSPLDSTGLAYWGEAGPGSWITVYANSGHAYAVIAGLRWDTSGTGGSGPSWSTNTTSFQDPSAFTARHPAGF